jgi:branched-chain amino acid transport system ATP-binding protein
MLSIEGLSTGYDGLDIVQDVSVTVNADDIFAIVGANGAGKTTLLRCISGLIRRSSGSIRFDGKDISTATPQEIVKLGLVHVPEGRELFPELSVRDNLLLGGILRTKAERESKLEEIYVTFPRLKDRDRQASGTLSGGEQQMVAIGRALMSGPRMLMLDEPSIGLAPKLVTAIFDLVTTIAASGITVLLVEQNAVQTLTIATRACVLESGRKGLEGTGDALLNDPGVRTAYLGL